ncbi:hypothetical protein ScPMuIL_007024 [Solemya velum]
MATVGLDEIREQLCRKWKLDRSENFDEFLKELGLNVVFRKMASAATPTIQLNMEGDMVNIVSKVAFFNHVIKIKVGGEVEQTFEGLKMKCTSRWEDGTLITEAIPCDDGRGKPQTFHRQLVDGELVQTMFVGDVKCVRIFKPVE